MTESADEDSPAYWPHTLRGSGEVRDGLPDSVGGGDGYDEQTIDGEGATAQSALLDEVGSDDNDVQSTDTDWTTDLGARLSHTSELG